MRLVIIPSSGTVPDSAEGCSKRLGRRSRDWRARSVGQSVGLVGIRWWLLLLLSVVLLMVMLRVVIMVRVGCARVMRRVKTGRRRGNVGRRGRRW